MSLLVLWKQTQDPHITINIPAFCILAEGVQAAPSPQPLLQDAPSPHPLVQAYPGEVGHQLGEATQAATVQKPTTVDE